MDAAHSRRRAAVYSCSLIAIAAVVAAAEQSAAQDTADSVDQPRVLRSTSTGPPRVWPVFSASSGGNEIRNCGWWRRGWKTFVDSHALPAVRQTGSCWIHNPGGVVFGESMRFDQFSDCSRQARETGQPELLRISRWRAFTAQMSRLSRSGRVLIYIGNPATMTVRDGEATISWIDRAATELGPVLAIRPKPILAFDATYGHPADPSRGYGRMGGPKGLIALLLTNLSQNGYEILVEPNILADATWLRGIAGVVSTEWYWETQLRYQDRRVGHPAPGWGAALPPTQVLGRQVRFYDQLWRRPVNEQLAVIRGSLSAGYDVAIGAIAPDELFAAGGR